MSLADFRPWLETWRLAPDGEPFSSTWSRLLPVRRDGRPLMLKACMADQEVNGSAFLAGYAGEGAVEVLEREADAVLLERAEGPLSLERIAAGAGEAEAYRILTRGVATLQAAAGPFPVAPIPLATWFSILPEAAAYVGGVGVYARAAGVLEQLLATTAIEVPLHGDLHHGNLLDGGRGRGWLAIDPKGLVGDPACDYAVMLFPSEMPGEIAAPDRVRARISVVAGMAGLTEARLMAWAFCVAAQYAGWFHGQPTGEAMMAVAVALADDGTLAGT
ncbi:aminoglycoside phosphotransferase family protein [Phenylobacterium parvum]|uniref:3'-kinase n=1 Tax=Phenylobacterium parvum TaxID=2201350 RepID=A0A2Z3I2Q1_9CAUL|nr:aminoglycoside phosphotransferase family protein [Phenylobacterium parvum]AWM77724.1 3'-kinase [Phenylobacterium parvum]